SPCRGAVERPSGAGRLCGPRHRPTGIPQGHGRPHGALAGRGRRTRSGIRLNEKRRGGLSMSYHGNPCWYELGTGDLAAAGDFYAGILGWQIADSGMEGFEYHLARSGDDMVAGMMSNAGQQGNPPPNWLIYFAVDDCDKTAGDIKAAGGKACKGPDDIPGTGRFAVVADPQRAVFD